MRFGIRILIAGAIFITCCQARSFAADAPATPYSGPPRLTPLQIQQAERLSLGDCIALRYPEQWSQGIIIACHATDKNLQLVRFNWLNAHSGNQDSDAELLLADEYFNGIDGVNKNIVEGIRLLQSAAEHGNIIAAHRLALRYFDGDGVSRDYQKAAHWFAEASKAQDYFAMAWYGWLLCTGQGVTKDEAQGLSLLNASDREGYPEAARLLGSKPNHGLDRFVQIMIPIG